MATIQTLVNRSFRLLGVVAQGETASSSDSTDAETALNAMLDGWRNDKLLVYANKDIAVTLINGTASYTIGATGGTVDTSPVEVVSAYVRQSDIDYFLTPLTDAQYQAKSAKSITSDIPAEYLFTHTHPNATITLYPVPTVANTMYVRVRTPLAAVALADTFALPPGYEEAIVFNLAMRLYPEYPALPLNPVIPEIARTSLAGIKRINHRPPVSITELGVMFGSSGRSHDIHAGE